MGTLVTDIVPEHHHKQQSCFNALKWTYRQQEYPVQEPMLPKHTPVPNAGKPYTVRSDMGPYTILVVHFQVDATPTTLATRSTRGPVIPFTWI